MVGNLNAVPAVLHPLYVLFRQRVKRRFLPYPLPFSSNQLRLALDGSRRKARSPISPAVFMRQMRLTRRTGHV